jgi:hypothetical protein
MVLHWLEERDSGSRGQCRGCLSDVFVPSLLHRTPSGYPAVLLSDWPDTHTTTSHPQSFELIRASASREPIISTCAALPGPGKWFKLIWMSILWAICDYNILVAEFGAEDSAFRFRLQNVGTGMLDGLLDATLHPIRLDDDDQADEDDHST